MMLVYIIGCLLAALMGLQLFRLDENKKPIDLSLSELGLVFFCSTLSWITVGLSAGMIIKSAIIDNHDVLEFLLKDRGPFFN